MMARGLKPYALIINWGKKTLRNQNSPSYKLQVTSVRITEELPNNEPTHQQVVSSIAIRDPGGSALAHKSDAVFCNVFVVVAC